MSNIIYIIGAGRSGTTLLDIIIGNGSDIFSAGELNRFTKRDGVPHDARDKEVEDFWIDVKKQLSEKGFNSPYSYYKSFLKFEYHSSALNALFKQPKDNYELYASYQKNLFEAISSKADKIYNKKIIVDSSKYPMRAFFLSKIFKKNISFIYVKRNAQSVIESFQKKEIEQPSKSRFKTNIYLLLVNGISGTLTKKLKKNHKVSTVIFEDLLASPLSVIDKIEKDLEINLQAPKAKLSNGNALEVGLLFDGNRLRQKKEIHFRTGAKTIKPKQIIDKLFFPLHKFF